MGCSVSRCAHARCARLHGLLISTTKGWTATAIDGDQLAAPVARQIHLNNSTRVVAREHGNLPAPTRVGHRPSMNQHDWMTGPTGARTWTPTLHEKRGWTSISDMNAFRTAADCRPECFLIPIGGASQTIRTLAHAEALRCPRSSILNPPLFDLVGRDCQTIPHQAEARASFESVIRGTRSRGTSIQRNHLWVLARLGYIANEIEAPQ